MIRIVCAYGDLMNLYGEYAAPLFLKTRLQLAGEKVEIRRFSLGETPDLRGCDLLLFPAGTEQAMLRALADLRPNRAEIAAYAEGGGRVLLTGNAGALFAESVTGADGRAQESLGLLRGKAAILPGRRYAEYILHGEAFGADLVGSINTSMTFDWEEDPLFTVDYESEPLLPGKTEGARRGNIMATQLTGPLLVRNPHALDRVCEALAGRALPPCAARWRADAKAGYRSVLEALKKEKGRG